MARMLVVGWEMPAYAPDARMEAANYRTWQLVEPLRRDGHDICLAAGRVGAEFTKPLPGAVRDGALTYLPVRFTQPFWIRQLQQVHDALRPDCIVAVTFLGALRATRIRTDVPLWFDIYGDQMAEMQAGAYRTQSDRGIVTQLGFLRQVLLAGDAFSTCSGAQRHALIGQLATAGRLNRATFGYEFVHVVPPGAGKRPVARAPGALRGSVVAPEARVALWCGGYNTWTDVETLFRGLELAMQGDPRLHFVSVGGALAHSDTYARFAAAVSHSRFAARFHLLGWQAVATIPSYYADADLGVTLDTACYEAELGTRTRLVEMMLHELPVVTTAACELSHTIRVNGLGLTFDIGDWQTMGRHILALSLDDERRHQMGSLAHVYVVNALSLESAAAPLRKWVRSPERAPDRRRPTRSEVYSSVYAARAFVRHALWSFAGLDQ